MLSYSGRFEITEMPLPAGGISDATTPIGTSEHAKPMSCTRRHCDFSDFSARPTERGGAARRTKRAGCRGDIRALEWESRADRRTYGIAAFAAFRPKGDEVDEVDKPPPP